MPTLILCRGLPASGKTTWARKRVAEIRAGGGKAARINRDDYRLMLYGSAWQGVDEVAVTTVHRAAIGALLAAGSDVVCDDTNLHSKGVRTLMQVAADAGADVEIVDEFLTVPVDECIRRDADRSASVGEEVILRMHQRYLAALKGRRLPIPELATVGPAGKLYVPPIEAPSAVLVDVDGTLALMDGRGPFEWHRVGEDQPNRPVIDLVSDLHDRGYLVVAMSGRDEVCRNQTAEWLARHGVPFCELYMRPAGDMRKDAVVKLELFDAHVRDRYRVCWVVDDRDQVVRMWRSLGLTCLQVADGAF